MNPMITSPSSKSLMTDDPIAIQEIEQAATGVAPSANGLAPISIDFTEHRPALLRFARRKIRDQDLAEDAVQDTLLAALASAGSFKGESAVRTWLIGILNHKIQDAFRRESRYQRVSGEEIDQDQSEATEALDRLMLDRDEPLNEDDPQTLAMRQQFMVDLVREVEQLPPTLREVFAMQAIDEVPTEEVCAKLNISEANCWVRLHRARKRLAERMGSHLN
jgi:RNA polymerase sigma-70 factor (ECF subfamily)